MYKQIVHINSADTINGSVTNFMVQLPKPIKGVKSILVKSVEIPFYYYVVNNNTNVVKVSNGTVTSTVTLANGNYSITDFIAALQAALIAQAFAGFTVTYSDVTNKLTIANATPFKFVLSGSTMATILGLTADTTLGTSATLQQVVNLSGTDCIYVLSDIIASSQNMPYVNNLIRPILHRVVVDVSPTQIIIDKAQAYLASEYFFSDQTDIQLVQLRLVDQSFADIDLNGGNWSIELHFSTTVI